MNTEKCSGHGTWYNNSYGGYCSCNSGWGGADCSQSTDTLCSGHGSWYNNSNGTGYCQCNSGWVGSNCAKACQHGIGSSCACEIGWSGEDCSIEEKEYCKHGIWISGTSYGSYWDDNGGYCLCERGWSGEQCTIPVS